MKITNRKTVYEGFFNVEKLTLEHEGQKLERDIYRNKDSVAALVYDTARKEFILIEQYRLAAERPLLEIVAGLMDKEGESPEKTIAREIEEETGYRPDRLEPIAVFYTSPGATAEKMYLYFAEVSERTGTGGGVETENEHINTLAFSAEKLKAQTFEDAKTLLAVNWLQARGRL